MNNGNTICQIYNFYFDKIAAICIQFSDEEFRAQKQNLFYDWTHSQSVTKRLDFDDARIAYL